MAPDAFLTNMLDRHEFAKFTKSLAYRSVQVIVESRKGIKIEPNSKHSTSDSDWFNLQIPDSQEVNDATRHALPSGKILETIRSRLNVEISVKTEDGDEMVLEVWTLHLDENQFDTSLKAMNTIYFRMSILLKSLITVTRITPVYHLSRKQNTESFTIFYRVYSGEPNLVSLGTSIKKMPAGLLKTPLGGISFNVVYRTNFSITPNQTENKTLLLKSDHFELSPKHVLCESKKRREPKSPPQIDLNKPLRLAAFVDEILVQKTIADFLKNVPLPVLKFRRIKKPPEELVIDTQGTQESDTDRSLSKSPTSLELPPKKFSGFPCESEPPLKLLQLPFADDHPIRELADFFNAPPHLKLADEAKTKNAGREQVEASNDDLSKDLELYENSLAEFDELLAEMCRSADWSGN